MIEGAAAELLVCRRRVVHPVHGAHRQQLHPVKLHECHQKCDETAAHVDPAGLVHGRSNLPVRLRVLFEVSEQFASAEDRLQRVHNGHADKHDREDANLIAHHPHHEDGHGQLLQGLRADVVQASHDAMTGDLLVGHLLRRGVGIGHCRSHRLKAEGEV
ncbi:protein of unknown function, putative [Leishmania tarentolae]|uniref:Uncharacterized protein n=1 Tax=Leishmania tarentolae TaxID=5689 RepID=A0A640KN50_LEITA|nr:protein of unknown function, putative [Leishmania tarentolae]GET90768.1 protein of unknown function, putative [Leishmania tarentolae]